MIKLKAFMFKIQLISSSFSYHMWWLKCPDKLAGLLVVCVGREGNVVH